MALLDISEDVKPGRVTFDDISFINIILIIVDNASDSRKSDNSYFSALDAPSSPHPFTHIVPGNSYSFTPIIFNNPHLSTLVESFNHSNSMADFLINILTNLFSNFDMDASSNLVVDPMPSPAIPFFSNLLVFS